MFDVGTSNKIIRQWLYKLSIKSLFNSFPNIYKILTLFVTILFTNYSYERSFSKLGLVKSNLRSYMTQDRLETLMLIFVEQELATQLNPEDIIEEFKHHNNTPHRIEL